MSDGRIETLQIQTPIGALSAVSGSETPMVNSAINSRIMLLDPTTLEVTAELDNDQQWSTIGGDRARNWVAFVEPGRVSLFDAETAERVASWEHDRESAGTLSFAPDGASLLVTFQAGGEAQRLSIPGLSEIDVPFDGEHVFAATYIGNGAILLTVDGLRRVQLRDPVSEEVLTTLETAQVAALATRPSVFAMGDGDTVLGEIDGKPQLWDASTGELIGGTFPNDPGAVFTASDGESFAITAVGDDLLVWDLDIDAWPDIACRAAGRNMTLDEWERLGPEGEPYEPTCPQWPSP